MCNWSVGEENKTQMGKRKLSRGWWRVKSNKTER